MNHPANTEKKTLYCIAYERWSVKRKKWIAELDYTHANDAGEARLTFFQDLQSNKTIVNPKGLMVAPVLGYFVDDNHGEELSV